MLNKEICKMCVNRYWVSWDEQAWKYDKIVYHYGEGEKNCNIDNGIPENCLYTLEHILLENK